MTDDDNDINNDKTPFEQALDALRNAENKPDEGDQLRRIFDALTIVSIGTREIRSAALNIRRKKIH